MMITLELLQAPLGTGGDDPFEVSHKAGIKQPLYCVIYQGRGKPVSTFWRCTLDNTRVKFA